MDTPLYNAKYYSHQPSSVDTITKYDEEFKEVTDSTIFVHIRKKPPIIQTIVLPPPPPPPSINNNYNLHPPANGGDNSSVLANSGQNGQGTYPTLNPPPTTPQAKEAQYVLMKMGVNTNRPIKVTESEGRAFIQEVNNMGGGDAGLGLYRVTDTGKLDRVTVSYGNPNTTSTVDGYKNTNY